MTAVMEPPKKHAAADYIASDSQPSESEKSG